MSQFDPKVLRLRLILAPGTRNLHDYLDVEQKGSALRIRVRKGSTAAPGDPLESLLARASRLQNNEVLEKKIPPEDTGRDPSALTRSVAAAQPSETPAGFSKANTSHRTRPLAQTLGQSLKKSAPKASAKPLILKTQKAGLLDLEDDEESQNPSLVSSSMKMIYTLTLVLGIMFLLFYLFKKFVLKNSVFGGEGKPIKVLSTGFLAPKKSIALVEVAGEVLVLGIANDHISLLANVNDPDRIAQVKNGLRKKKNDDQGPVSDFQEKEEESAESRGRGVDNYKKRLVEPGSTNPFSQYVKNFTVEKPAEPALQKDPGPRRKKVFDKVPVFK
ncbi:MAG: flagellar biosynthetic protein FliO [Nitrospinaceae bacterium]|nr:flagellar biosynthetic protein FliO [Nitrospinaceae bacterium]NIR54997.1 flagellar biosynthetic protein FliO [Nitrospinaceae bacterium]NIT82237.1 flagellar biosynthetic protein FliO [Nitrospinaceae bacterium]NIY15454.1 flagellar biosynthetic protein FliO [Nitrospinaceae bacterium]